MTQPQAAYIYRWLGFFSFVAVYGYFCVDLAHSVHVPAPAVNAFSSLLGLILVIMTITVIVQKRAYVAVMLRGRLSAAQRDLTPAQSLRLWFARSWHMLAIAYLVIGYLVTALERRRRLRHSFARHGANFSCFRSPGPGAACA